jgi:hypothetical protein
MPKNKVSDPITDQEIAFARLVLSGAMTDRHAAEAVGLNSDSAAYTKSKPRVRAYMLEHRAAVQQQLVRQEADGLHRLNLDREQVLNRLGNRQPQPRYDPRQHYRPGQGPLHDRSHGRPDPRPSSRLLPREKISPCTRPANLWLRLACRAAGHNHRPAAKPCTCPTRRFAWRPRAQARLGGRGASGPCPQPVHLRQTLQSLGSLRPLCPPVRFCSRLESGFLYKEPLCPPPLSRQIPKSTQKYQILKMAAR